MSLKTLYFTMSLLIALALGHLAMFCLILIYGEFLVREPSVPVLALEMGAILAIIGFAIATLVSLFRK